MIEVQCATPAATACPGETLQEANGPPTVTSAQNGNHSSNCLLLLTTIGYLLNNLASVFSIYIKISNSSFYTTKIDAISKLTLLPY